MLSLYWLLETVVEKVGILVHRCHTILSKNLKIQHFCQHTLPRMLTQNKYSDCMRVSDEFIIGADFLCKMITCDEALCFLYSTHNK
jgi:hypothetical protein